MCVYMREDERLEKRKEKEEEGFVTDTVNTFRQVLFYFPSEYTEDTGRET